MQTQMRAQVCSQPRFSHAVSACQCGGTISESREKHICTDSDVRDTCCYDSTCKQTRMQTMICCFQTRLLSLFHRKCARMELVPLKLVQKHLFCEWHTFRPGFAAPIVGPSANVQLRGCRLRPTGSVTETVDKRPIVTPCRSSAKRTHTFNPGIRAGTQPKSRCQQLANEYKVVIVCADVLIL